MAREEFRTLFPFSNHSSLLCQDIDTNHNVIPKSGFNLYLSVVFSFYFFSCKFIIEKDIHKMLFELSTHK